MVELIKDMCRINGVSGDEGRIREFIKSRLKDTECETETDSMGNLYAVKKGQNADKTILISANMDEPGFIVSGYTDKGYLKFKPVGNIDTRNIISKRISIGNGDIKGVIGMKAIHLQKKEERENTVNIKDLFIDIGASSKEEAQKAVELGEYVTFDKEPVVLGKSRIAAKALASRIPCVVLLKFFKEIKADKYNICACFTAQKETGARGAAVAAKRIKPFVSFVIDSVESADGYNIDEKDKTADLGGGAVIEYANRRTLHDRELTKEMYDLSVKNGIRVQMKNAGNAFSDAWGIQTVCGGVKTVSAGIPIRYKNTPVSMADINDADCVIGILKEFINAVKG